ncbi:trehalase-like domain-containing protein [Mycobacterium ostraviense]|uniref:trehalase-like domain-containing protein n=1 Tax=Mycobacterium ostraviense TaxID=2738409 RepID=UPI0038CC04D8
MDDRPPVAELLSPHVLREYAVLADGERGIVIGPRGDCCWMCLPRWDSPAVFGSLLGGNGVYAVSPDHPRFVWGLRTVRQNARKCTCL